MKRLRLSLANQQVEFVDRDLALKRIEDWANRGVAFPQVIYGPEGCGKTAWLRQSTELLKGLGFEVIYVNPVESAFMVKLGITDLRDRLMSLIQEALEQFTWGKVIWSIISIARSAIEAGARKLAIIVDDAFQAIGLDNAAIYVKGLLGILEHPPASYDRVITIAATSEGVSRREIGRHEWADLMPIWNMPREGFKQLYEQLPGNKPDFEDIWKLTGGNPRILERLYESNWSSDAVVRELIDRKGLRTFIESLNVHERELLAKAIDDPDTLMSRDGIPLMNRLIELNLALEIPEWRDLTFWIDQPPPERDPELGIGKYVAWQSPMHREAVRRVLEP
ncbi:ATP-binding protein [Vulcanisaeta sp. JCM 14467]